MAESKARQEAEEQARLDNIADIKDRLNQAYEREADAFRSTVDQFTRARQVLMGIKDDLSGSLGGNSDLAMLKARLNETGALAAGGDVAAMEALPGLLRQIAPLLEDRSATRVDYQRQIEPFAALVDQALKVANDKVDYEQEQLDMLTRQVDQLEKTNEKLETVADLVKQLKDATEEGNDVNRQLLTNIATSNNRIDRTQRAVTSGGVAMRTEAA